MCRILNFLRWYGHLVQELQAVWHFSCLFLFFIVKTILIITPESKEKISFKELQTSCKQRRLTKVAKDRVCPKCFPNYQLLILKCPSNETSNSQISTKFSNFSLNIQDNLQFCKSNPDSCWDPSYTPTHECDRVCTHAHTY